MTDATQSDTAFRPKPSLPPPANTVGAIGWLRKNLFGGPVDTVLTLLGLYLVYLILQFVVEYGLVNAIWTADTYRECLDINKGEGACWAGIGVWFNSMMYGRYPDEEQWRINFGGIILLLWLIPFWLPKVTGKIQVGMSAVLTFPFLAASMFIGGEIGIFLSVMTAIALTFFVSVWLHVASSYLIGRPLSDVLVSITGFANKDDRLHKYVLLGAFGVGLVLSLVYISTWDLVMVPTTIWGGLFLTLVISGIGISSALPSGILLALGRRSKMPVIRVFCTAFIELFRSVPLITILFMAVTMMPLFLPVELNPPKLAMVIVAVCIFAAAYMAETVRGGLQAVNKGQYEAAQAMGLNFWKMMALIVMPQALKLMIPNIVGSFMGLMKDTTLVSIIGLYDILLMGKAAGQNPSWLGFHTEPLLFTAAIFFVLCFAMSKYSQHLERTIGGGYGRR